MILTFHSIDNDDNKIIYKTEYIKKDNLITFDDKSMENTQIHLTIESDSIHFQRVGDNEMDLMLIYNQKTTGFYKNSIGLEFEFEVFTSGLTINSKRISIKYTMFLEGNPMSTHKIWILFH